MNTVITNSEGQVVRWYSGGLMHGGVLEIGETATEYNDKGLSTGSIYKYREYNPFTLSYIYTPLAADYAHSLYKGQHGGIKVIEV